MRGPGGRPQGPGPVSLWTSFPRVDTVIPKCLSSRHACQQPGGVVYRTCAHAHVYRMVFGPSGHRAWA
eukprot:7347018-Pyramimonas_sp.AAC.1